MSNTIAIDAQFFVSRTEVSAQVKAVMQRLHGLRFISRRGGKNTKRRIELGCFRSGKKLPAAALSAKRNNSVQLACACPARVVLVLSKTQPDAWRVSLLELKHQHTLMQSVVAHNLVDSYQLVRDSVCGMASDVTCLLMAYRSHSCIERPVQWMTTRRGNAKLLRVVLPAPDCCIRT